MSAVAPAGIEVIGPVDERARTILAPEAIDFLAMLHREHEQTRTALLAVRSTRQHAINNGATLNFLSETASIRHAEWRGASPAPRLADRRVEITGPTDAKMTINALNSGARVWLADFEDANTPCWENMVGGQANLRDSIDDVLSFTNAEGRTYSLRPADERPTIVVRPRGWHLPEKHLLIDGKPISGSLFDFGLYFFHCARRQIERGAGPYFYLPKIESYLEARLWNDVFVTAQQALGIPRGTIRATALIETIHAAFQMDEMLYELREHSAGLNAGRWDYLFSLIKTFRTRGEHFLLPDRNQVSMTAPMMRAYTDLLVKTCHRRGVHAIGGMAAFIPSRRDSATNESALACVRADKEREAADGFDGSWVAHPDLVGLCNEVFTSVLGTAPDQRHRTRNDVHISAAQLLDVSSTPGAITEDGLRNNVSVALEYLRSWLAGNGAVAIFNMMEDAATAEICRSQIWQWLHNKVKLAGGPVVDHELVRQLLTEEQTKLGNDSDLHQARSIFDAVTLADDFAEFLTLPAYDLIP